MLPPETRARIGKLILVLGSDKEGEVVNAVAAILRTLKASGADLHEIAALVTGRQSGWVPDRAKRTAAASASGQFNYANAYKKAEPLFEGPEIPDGLTRKFGLPIYSPEIVEPWSEVARHCLHLNRRLPKKHGGKFLEDWEKKMLQTLIDDRRHPTNRHVEWIERTIARLHQARDAAQRAEAAGG